MRRRPLVSRRRFLAAGAGVTGALALPTVTTGSILGAPERLGIGLIGCGGRGSHHLGVLGKLKAEGAAIDLVAVCDVYRPRLERAARAEGAKAYSDHRELLQDPRVDAVCIATPDHHHAPQAIDAVRAGKDVYCEKPLTHWRQVELPRLLQAEVRRTGRVLQVGTQGLSDPAWRQAGELLRAGDIGRPIQAECGYFRVGDWGERGMPIDDPEAKAGPDLHWDAFLGDSPAREFSASRFFRWRLYMDYAGGPVTDLYPHSLTPVVKMLGVTWPETVVATGGIFRYEEREVPDTFSLFIDYPEKVTVAVLGTQANDHAGSGQRGAGSRLPILRGWEGSITFEGGEIVVTPVRGVARTARRIPIEGSESEAEHWKDFINSCRTRQAPRSSVDLGCQVQVALQMGMRSFLERRAARFDAQEKAITT